MDSTYDKFITNDPKQKTLFDHEYKDFLLSEEKNKKPEEENPSVQLPPDPPNPS